MEMVRERQLSGRHVCVGLDSEQKKIPECLRKQWLTAEETVLTFNKEIVEATARSACAFKINIAFYSSFLGGEGALIRTTNYIHHTAPGIPVILDAKRADIGNTNIHYAQEAFKKYNADAVTVNPYFGRESLQPFLDEQDKGIFILCRTSNRGAAEFQSKKITVTQQDEMFALGLDPKDPTVELYKYIAMLVAYAWNEKGNCALVVGATAPDELAQVRSIVGDMQLLIPGIGAQGGQLEETVLAGADNTGTGMIINSSRGIIFASEKSDFAVAAAREAEKLNCAIKASLANRNQTSAKC